MQATDRHVTSLKLRRQEPAPVLRKRLPAAQLVSPEARQPSPPYPLRHQIRARKRRLGVK